MADSERLEQDDHGDYLSRNRREWTRFAADYAVRNRANWAGEPSWGVWGIPERDVGLLPDDVAGLDVLEDGCGTGYVSSWFKRLGANPVGLDPTWAQIETAVGFQNEFDIRFPIVSGAGENLPFKSASFDLVFSEYGAAIWADPYKWIPEAARVLRPGGRLIFMGGHALLMLCVPDLIEEGLATNELRRPYFGMYRLEWDDDDTVNFHLPHGDWIRLLRANGFEIEDLLELQPPADSKTTYDYVDLEWARKWPCEEAWKARKLS